MDWCEHLQVIHRLTGQQRFHFSYVIIEVAGSPLKMVRRTLEMEVIYAPEWRSYQIHGTWTPYRAARHELSQLLDLELVSVG